MDNLCYMGKTELSEAMYTTSYANEHYPQQKPELRSENVASAPRPFVF